MTCQTIEGMNPTQGVIIIFRQRKKAKIITIIAIFLLIIASILYGLANRYLFEHVEVVVAPNNITTTQAEPVKQSTAQAQADDWNYKDDNETVSIKKVQIGSGSDTITYFVADVTFNTNYKPAYCFRQKLLRYEHHRKHVDDRSKQQCNLRD